MSHSQSESVILRSSGGKTPPDEQQQRIPVIASEFWVFAWEWFQLEWACEDRPQSSSPDGGEEWRSQLLSCPSTTPTISNSTRTWDVLPTAWPHFPVIMASSWIYFQLSCFLISLFSLTTWKVLKCVFMVHPCWFDVHACLPSSCQQDLSKALFLIRVGPCHPQRYILRSRVDAWTPIWSNSI